MKKMIMVLAATLICGASVLVSCSTNDEAVNKKHEPFTFPRVIGEK